MKSVKELFRIFLRRGAKSSDIVDYITGHYRYFIYHSDLFGSLMRRHIREQIEFRIEVMNIHCYVSGECRMCGCETTQLQMVNRPCEDMCYPKMMDKYWWRIFGKDLKKVYNEDREAYKDLVFDINKHRL